jgi:hypothetical protein
MMSSASYDPAASLPASAADAGNATHSKRVERGLGVVRSRYVQAAMTYLTRPRFWLLGAAYLTLVYWRIKVIDPRLQVPASTNLAVLLACSVALHMRRQFGAPAAHLAPGFAAPHLAVGAFMASLGWLVVPLVQMATGHWPWTSLAFHAVAGLFGAVVVCWPKAMLGLAALPVAFFWSSYMLAFPNTFLSRLLAGAEPEVAIGIFGAAVAAQGVAGWSLVRERDRSVPFGDELVLEPSVAKQSSNFAARFLLTTRDAAAAGMLEWSDARLWPITRWRVPVVVSWAQWAMPVAFALAMVVVMLVQNEPAWAVVGAVVTTSVLMVAPFSGWHARRRALATELLRPVSRGRFFAEQALALALDVVLWNVLSSAIAVSLLEFMTRYFRHDFRTVDGVLWYLAIQWSMAFFVYGLALATIRWHYWVFLITAVGIGWLCGFWMVVGYHAATSKRGLVVDDTQTFLFLTVVLGLVMGCLGFRRMLTSEPT